MTWLAWIASSRLGRAVAGAVGLLALILAYGAKRERRGEKKVLDRAEAAAEKRKEIRREVDSDTDVNAARDRVRDDWTN